MEYSTNKITNKQLDKLITDSNCAMNSIGIQIPYSFISRLVKLNWCDLLFAIDNIYLPLNAVIEHAMKEIEENPNYQETVVDLAILSTREVDYYYPEIKKILIELARQVSDKEKSEVQRKILYTLLKWVFEHRECYVDPLRVVEIIYDDFNYPKSMENFVRFIPSTEPLLGTIDANIERLFNNWANYLEVQEYTVERLKRLGVNKYVIKLVELGCELEDVESLIPDKLTNSLDQISIKSTERLRSKLKSVLPLEKWIDR